jgi:hypothetical protein
MDPRDATSNNADLWAAHLAEQWMSMVDPFHLMRSPATEGAVRAMAEATAATIANVVAVTVGAPVTAMYRNNAPDVTRAIAAQATPESEQIPAEYSIVSEPREYEAPRQEMIVSYREPALVG